MESDLERLTDARRHFHGTYLRTTIAVGEEIERGGFADNAWLERWDLVFAELYLDALEADVDGKEVPKPWRVAFDAPADLPPLRHVLLGMNAHINYDLPQALIAVITPDEFDDKALLERREADHRHVDDVLVARVAEEAKDGPKRLLDRILAPANRAATRRLLVESRRKVWHNTAVLDKARRDGTYDQALKRLEELCAARVAELTAPGQVLLRLARRGFGVTLDPWA